MSLRMRTGAKITELNISEETRAMVEEIEKNTFGNKNKAKYLKQILGFSLCCLCRGVPSKKLNLI